MFQTPARLFGKLKPHVYNSLPGPRVVTGCLAAPFWAVPQPLADKKPQMRQKLSIASEVGSIAQSSVLKQELIRWASLPAVSSVRGTGAAAPLPPRTQRRLRIRSTDPD